MARRKKPEDPSTPPAAEGEKPKKTRNPNYCKQISAKAAAAIEKIDPKEIPEEQKELILNVFSGIKWVADHLEVDLADPENLPTEGIYVDLAKVGSKKQAAKKALDLF